MQYSSLSLYNTSLLFPVLDTDLKVITIHSLIGEEIDWYHVTSFDCPKLVPNSSMLGDWC